MKVKIRGNVGKQEVLETIAMVLNSFEDKGVNEFGGVNLYFTPYVSGTVVKPLHRGLEFDLLYKGTQKHLTVTENGEGSEDVAYDKDIAPSDYNLAGRTDLSDVVLRTNAEILAKNRLEADLKRIKQEKAERERLEYLKVKETKDSEDKAIALTCQNTLLDKYGLSVDEFLKKKSSSGWLTSKRGIEKYTDKRFLGRAYRVSMKVDGSREKHVHLFNTKCELVFDGIF